MANAKVVWGFSLLPIVVALLLFGSKPVVSVVVYAAVAVGLWEFYTMTFPKGRTGAKLLVTVAGLAVALSFYTEDLAVVLCALVTAFLLLLVGALFFEPSPEEALSISARGGMGFLYVAVLSSFLVLLKGAQARPPHVNWLVLLFLVVWINDAGAYFAGRKYGRRKLFERISPKKTVEGAIGGLVASLVAVLVWNAITGAFRWPDALLAGLALGVVGPVGDLVESMLKRATGVKDSGSLIPGHGGVLDRVDSIIFAAPFLYFFIYFRYIRHMI